MKTRLQILSCALMMLVFAGNLCAQNLTITAGNNEEISGTETYDAVTIEAGGVLTIKPSGVLIVGEGGITVPAGDYSCLILEVDGPTFTGGQVLVRPRKIYNTPEETKAENDKWDVFHPCATVRLISRAFYDKSTSKEAWQRYTAPTINKTPQNSSYNFETEVKGFIYPTADGQRTYTYQYSNAGAAWTTTPIFPLADQLTTEFECWNMICNATTPGTTYDIQGNLRTNNDLYISVVNRWSHFVNGYNANISTAAFINQMVKTYPGRTSGVVYVCKPNNSGEIKVKNDTYTWLAVSYQNAASEPWIAPMQAFFVEHTSQNLATPEACKFAYEDIVYNPAMAPTSSVAPRQIADNGINAKARIQLTMDGSLLDEVIMSEAEYFGDTLDWGYDARQYNQDIANLYCNAAEGQMTHLATNNLDGTTMGFNTQLAGTYKLVFSMVEGEELILRDLATQQQVAIANGFEYTFTAAGNYSSSARFQVVKANAPTAIQNAKNQNKATKLIENGQLYILRNGKKLDVLGK